MTSAGGLGPWLQRLLNSILILSWVLLVGGAQGLRKPGWTRRLGQGLHGLGFLVALGAVARLELMLVQQQSQLPPLFAAAARLSFVFEPRVPAMGSGWRLPARPDVFSGCCGLLLMFAAFSVSGCSCASLSTLRYRQQSSHAVPTTHSVLSVGAAP